MTHLHLDFETRSKINLRTQGLDLYARNAEVLMLGWAFDDEPVKLWLGPDIELAPGILQDALLDPQVEKVAWNAPFERAIFQHALGIDIPMWQWLDPKAIARYVGLPASLAGASKFFNLSEDEAKDKEGKRLITWFCLPKKDGTFRSPAEYPEKWEKFKAYCKQDVVAERVILGKLLPTYALPPREEKIRLLDAQINEVGLPVDLKFVSDNTIAVGAEKSAKMIEFKALTGLDNPNSRAQLLPWLQARGYSFNSLAEKNVQKVLANGSSELVKQALRLRLDTSRASVAKLPSLLKRVSPDARLRHAYRYYGAHTGRWSGEGVQPHNLSRNATKIGNVEVNTRNVFRAPAGSVLTVGDESQIEVRVNAWLAGCDTLLDKFKRIDAGEDCDIYKDFAAETLYHIAYEYVTKQQRQIAKSAVLGAGFQISGGDEVYSCCRQKIADGHKEKCKKDGDVIKTGLWGYAANMGINMTRDEAHTAVKAFREGYWEIPRLWRNLQDAAYGAVLNPGKWIDGGPLKFAARPERMVIELPTGRRLYYLEPRITQGEWPDGRPKQQLTYRGLEHREATYGGKLCENVVQAIARDVLAEAMLRADERGLKIVGHTHDEIIAEGACKDELKACLTEPMPWAPDIPLGAAVDEMEAYSK